MDHCRQERFALTHVSPWVKDRGYRCFKIKLLAKDDRADAERTAEVYRGVKALGVVDPWISIDTNEGNPNANSVLNYLTHLKEIDAEAFEALKYLEQPTGRDITVHQYDWHEIGKLKPVMLDEGLTGLAMMPLAEEQGWTGFALKTCKGHSFALVSAAWAKQHNMPVVLQDLTNPGISMIHAALFASHIDMVNDVELNSPQFTPAANEAWLPRLGGLFDPHDGVHKMAGDSPVGLGSTL